MKREEELKKIADEQRQMQEEDQRKHEEELAMMQSKLEEELEERRAAVGKTKKYIYINVSKQLQRKMGGSASWGERERRNWFLGAGRVKDTSKNKIPHKRERERSQMLGLCV